MEVRNCKRCNKVINYFSGYPLCLECKAWDEREFRKVRDYVRLNPGVSVEEVSRTLEMPTQQIIRYIKEERLEVHRQSNTFIICELCGANIMTGRFCSKCKEKIDAEIKRLENEALATSYYNQNGDDKTKEYIQEKLEKNQRKLRYLQQGE